MYVYVYIYIYIYIYVQVASDERLPPSTPSSPLTKRLKEYIKMCSAYAYTLHTMYVYPLDYLTRYALFAFFFFFMFIFMV